jgi:hypothetical protein
MTIQGATPKAIEERIAKLKREAKVSDGKEVAHTGSKPGPKKKRNVADLNGIVVTGRAAKKNPTFELEIPPFFGMGAIEDDDEKPLWQLKREKPWGLNIGQKFGWSGFKPSETVPMEEEVKEEQQPMDEDACDDGAYEEEMEED